MIMIENAGFFQSYGLVEWPWRERRGRRKKR
jgi:hypothetical protein